MEKIDGRKLSLEVQQQIRYMAIRLCKNGKSHAIIAKILGVSLETIRKCWKLYEKGGYQNLKIKKRGIKTGSNSKLDSDQFQKLKQILIEKTPDQLELNFSLWTRHAIQILIMKLWNVLVCLPTISRYMKRLGFTPQKPIKIAYEQNSKIVNKWLEIDYPRIAKQAKKEGAEIHWIDETRISSYSNYLRGYAPRGITPIISMKSKRLNINIISSVSKLGKMRFMTYKESLNTKIFIKFVSRLCKDLNRKVFIILDNLAFHHSKKFIKWLERKKDRIEAFYLPSYSPELNPDERLNRDLKTHFHSGGTVKNKTEFKTKVISHLKSIQRRPYRILNYFNSKNVRYAA